MIRRSVVATVIVLAAAGVAMAQDGGAGGGAPPGQVESHSLFEFVKAGGLVGYFIIALSVVASALVIDTLMRLRRDKLLPGALVTTALELSEAGRIGELSSVTKSSDSLFGRLVGGALERGKHGIEAVRQEMQQIGEAEITKLRHRVGWIGVIATAAPMLGLLGTVIGMIGSFQVLGHSRNAARPDELAVGISTALVTTCEGLVLAVPLIFAHAFMKDKVTGVAQEMGHLGERVLTLIAPSQPGARPPVAPAPGTGPIPGSRPVTPTSIPGPVTVAGTSGYGAVRS